MKPLPWRAIHDWICNNCGLCCMFNVPLQTKEWIQITRQFGYNGIMMNPSNFQICLSKDKNKRCVFQMYYSGRWICGIQNNKPLACKTYPFQVLSKPEHGSGSEALLSFKGHDLYIYVDEHCLGLRFGKPSDNFIKTTLREFVEISLMMRGKQYYSTSQLIGNRIPLTTQMRRIV